MTDTVTTTQPVPAMTMEQAQANKPELIKVSSLSPARRRRYERWRKLVDEFDKSGMGLLAFCRERGIDKKIVRRARQQLRCYTTATFGREMAVTDEQFQVFWNYWANDSKPSLRRCWERTRGTFLLRGENVDSFPCASSFGRRLVRDIPAPSRYLVREGTTRWRSKYGYHVFRDYSKTLAGAFWCSDHAQVDVAVMCPDGRVRFPWVTSWVDVKTYKWLGWHHHWENPNSDHIALAFLNASERYGIPADISIDNGKDYLARDIAGGRTKVRAESLDAPRLSIMDQLSIKVHFAKPYNARAKIIERRFREMNESFSRFCPGYRGPHIMAKPESLRRQISSGNILSWDEYCMAFDEHAVAMMNATICRGAHHKGLSPEQLWAAEYPLACEQGVVRHVDERALAIFCSKVVTRNITANGIHYPPLNCYYYDEWMYAHIGQRVDLRIRRNDPSAPAWVFAEGTTEYIGTATARMLVAVNASAVGEDAELAEAMKNQAAWQKHCREQVPVVQRPEIFAALAAQTAHNKDMAKRSGISDTVACVPKKAVALTSMDAALAKHDAQVVRDQFDVTTVLPAYEPRRALSARERADREFEEMGDEIAREWEARKVVAG